MEELSGKDSRGFNNAETHREVVDQYRFAQKVGQHREIQQDVKSAVHGQANSAVETQN